MADTAFNYMSEQMKKTEQQRISEVRKRELMNKYTGGEGKEVLEDSRWDILKTSCYIFSLKYKCSDQELYNRLREFPVDDAELMLNRFH